MGQKLFIQKSNRENYSKLKELENFVLEHLGKKHPRSEFTNIRNLFSQEFRGLLTKWNLENEENLDLFERSCLDEMLRSFWRMKIYQKTELVEDILKLVIINIFESECQECREFIEKFDRLV